MFAPSSEPTFVSIPQNRFVEPFVLNNGTWTIIIEAEGILLVSLAHVHCSGWESACGGVEGLFKVRSEECVCVWNHLE